MTNSKKGYLPMTLGMHLSETQSPQMSEDIERMSRVPYASAEGLIMYAIMCSRPDVAYEMGIDLWRYIRLCAISYADANFQHESR